MATILFSTFLILVIIGIPIAFSLGISALITLVYHGNVPLVLLPQRLFTGSDSFILLCIPFFMLTGELMDSSGIAQKLLRFCNLVVGHIRGGLAHANILISMIFAGITGAAAADSSAIGRIVIPAMIEEGYDKDFTCAVTASSSAIGVIIPPSIPMVLYGAITGVSVTRLFLAGFIPGIMVGVAQMITSYVIALKRGYPRHRFPGMRELFRSFLRALPALGMPVILIGGILAGVFTPTEAGVVAVLYGVVVAMFYYKNLKLSDLPKLCVNAITNSAAVMLMVAAASLYGWLITYTRIPNMLGDFLLSLSIGKTGVLMLIAVIYLVAGCIMDMGANIIMLTPIFYPVVIKLGINPVQFGLVTIVLLAIGLVTPPVCVCTYIVSTPKITPSEPRTPRGSIRRPPPGLPCTRGLRVA